MDSSSTEPLKSPGSPEIIEVMEVRPKRRLLGQKVIDPCYHTLLLFRPAKSHGPGLADRFNSMSLKIMMSVGHSD
jgi:hypothetical protein